MKSSAAFDKNTVEFVTVAAEYCAYLEQVFDKEPERVLDVLCKLLPLVYLKATMLPEAEPEGLYLEECVTEADYEEIRTYVQQYLLRKSKSTQSLIESTGRRGYYRLNTEGSADARQLMFQFHEERVEKEEEKPQQDLSLDLFD